MPTPATSAGASTPTRDANPGTVSPAVAGAPAAPTATGPTASSDSTAPVGGQSAPGAAANPVLPGATGSQEAPNVAQHGQSSEPGAGSAATSTGSAATSTIGGVAATQADPRLTAPTTSATGKDAPTRSGAQAPKPTVTATAGASADSGTASLSATASATVPDALASPATASASAATATGGPQAQALGYSVNLEQTIEAIHATIELASRQGLSQARIALHPAELGEISIHLSQSSQGLVARVTADTQAAAQALAEGHGELHQSLSSLGVAVLRLDIGSSAQGNAQGAPSDQSANGHSAPAQSSRRRAPGTEDELQAVEQASEQTPIESTPTLAGAALIDVLA